MDAALTNTEKLALSHLLELERGWNEKVRLLRSAFETDLRQRLEGKWPDLAGAAYVLSIDVATGTVTIQKRDPGAPN